MKNITLILALASCLNSWAQNNTFNTVSEGVQRMEMTSKNTGDSYNINVNLPFGYTNSEKSYPVLYTLDGNVTFGMVSDITKLISFEKPHSAVIVVGISYASYNDWISKRGRDFMPNFQSTEDIDNYLTFITEELIPKVSKDFRVKPNENIIYGHSSAAIFGFYSMFKNPNVFHSYILTSPSVDEDGGYILKMYEEFKASNLALNINLYTSIGKAEKTTFIVEYDKFSKQLETSTYQNLLYRSGVFDGTHMSTMAPSFVKGFEFVFSGKTQN